MTGKRIKIRRRTKVLQEPDNAQAGQRAGARTRINFVLDLAQIRRLRRILKFPSNSAAVRRAIEEHLAVEDGLEAMRDLRKSGAFKELDNIHGRTFRSAARRRTLR